MPLPNCIRGSHMPWTEGTPLLCRFAAHGGMVKLLDGFAAHCVTQWRRRLIPLHAAPMADFLGGFFPPARAGTAPLRPYQWAKRRPRCPPARPAEQAASSGAAQPAAAHGVPSSRRGLGKGRGSTRTRTRGSAPRMGRRHASAAGQRATGLPIAAGTDTRATPVQRERRRTGDRTSRNHACGGCRMRSGSPRP